MKAIGTINLNFGLTTISLKVNSFLDYGDIPLKQLCPKCKKPINYVKKCLACNQEYQYQDLLSGFEISKDNIVEVDKKIFDNIDRTSKILAIIDTNTELEFLANKFYLLTPQKDNRKPYFLLRNILLNSNKSLVIQYSLRKKLNLGIVKTVRIKDFVFLMLKQILYYERIKPIEQLEEEEVTKEEMDLGTKLFEIIAQKLNNINYTMIKDNRKEILEKYVRGETKEVEQVKPITNVMEDLKKSIEVLSKPKEEVKKVKKVR
jgi:DNA end-binding protein Ku